MKEPWQAVEYELLSKLFRDGRTDSQIGELLLRTPRDVQHIRQKMGLFRHDPPNHWTPEQDVCLETMFLAGATDQEIADEIGRSKDSVGARRSKLNLFKSSQESANVPRLIQLSGNDLLKMTPLKENEESQSIRAYKNTAFLIAMLRAGHMLGAGELRNDPESIGLRFYPSLPTGSYCGSPAAMCVG
jgi:hypothetical protein